MTAGTDVIKVGVSETNSFDFFEIIFEVFNVRHHVVDAWVIITGKQNTHIDDDSFVFILDNGHVFTNTKFTGTADWDNED